MNFHLLVSISADQQKGGLCVYVCVCAFVSELESMFSIVFVCVCLCVRWTGIHSSLPHLAQSLSITLLLIDNNLTVNTPLQQPLRTMNSTSPFHDSDCNDSIWMMKDKGIGLCVILPIGLVCAILCGVYIILLLFRN